MPLINGQKMACEPCIRGHRSTKCTHANERLMVPVRKPGRPLSTSPPPPSRGCGCGSVTAAIPRKQKCNCGPSTPADSDIIKVESPASEAVPTSPARSSTVSSASYRVQKQSSKPSSRKQSFGPATLDRIDSSQFNIIPAFDAAQTIPPHLNGGMDAMGMPTPRPSMEYGQMPMMGPDGILQSHMVFPMYQTPMPPIMLPPDVQKQPGGPTMAAPKPPTANPATDSPKNGGGGSCCSGGAKSAKTTPPASTESSPKVAPKPSTGSCCSSKNKSPPSTKNGTLNGTPLPPINGVAVPPFQPPTALASQVFQQYYPQPTLFHYPASYGSYMTPLQPAQWRQTMQALQYRQALPANGSYDIPTPMVYGQNASPVNGMGTSHECTCGDGCQCVGCAAHPYNNATQDYVRSAWQSMVEDSYQHSNGHGLHVANGSDGANGANGTNGHADGINGASDLPPSRDGEVSGSPTAPQTPSDATSGVGEELSANDFFFVNYPFGGDSCSGETAFCPCGDDCQCLGCSIHNNTTVPVPEE
ncbi:AMP deaminase [Verticillium dahliae VDG1]|nr:AMP deaminase [Verticillium dahliae VDG1]